MSFGLQINTTPHQQLGGWEITSLVHFFPCCWCPPHLGMDEFTVFFHMTKDMMWLLEISLDVHVSTLSQCWQVLWVVVGCMCNVNMCITSYKWLCFMGSWKNLFITAHGVGMKFNVCRSILKPLNSCDSTSQLYLHQINCDFFIHEASNCGLYYVGNLDSNFHKMYINFVLVNIH
jgi:hypothetical protein